MLRAKARQERLRWCRQRRQFRADYWKQFVFTDECRSKIRSDGRVWVRRNQNERYNPRCTLSFSNDRQSLYFRGAIACDGTMRLFKGSEKCSSLDYIHILEEAVVQFLPELGYELVDNNAPIHRSHAVNEWKTRNAIKSVPWPVQSPDLNLIENIWAFMKTQLRSMKLEFPDLEGAVFDIWNKTSNKLMSKLYVDAETY